MDIDEIYDNLLNQLKIKQRFQNHNRLINDLTSKNTNIFITGVGKSANISKHFSDMLKSINISSFYLNITDLTHGDLGCIKNNDIIIIISKSGNTEELIVNINHIKQKTENIIGIFCNKYSKLETFCKYTIILKCEKELDDNNILPTTSVIIFHMFISIIITKINNITKKSFNYKENHPRGNIGNKLTKTAKDIMIPIKSFPIINYDKNISDCMLKMCEYRTSSCIINNEENFGIICDIDIRKCLSDNNFTNKSLKDLYIKNPFNVKWDMNINNILLELKKNNYHYLSGIPVYKNGKLIGVIDNKSLIEYI
jgi:arabinose-5-phosphate isomerase